MKGLLVFALVAYGTLLTVAAVALYQPTKGTVLAVSAQPQEPALTFPVSIAGTPLIALGTVCYEGPFSEAESLEPVANGLALMLENTSDREILYAQVLLQNTLRTYCFGATHIPPGAKILVVEAKGAAWQAESYTQCTGTAECASAQPMQGSIFAVGEGDMGGVNVTNNTAAPIGKLRLYYKNYLPESNIYLGGGTFTATIEDLMPGQTRYVPLKYYASGYSRVLKVEPVT